MRGAAAAVLAALLLGCSAQAEVLVLNDTNFDTLTAHGTWMVNVYAPWCSHCKQLHPVWERVAQRLEGHVSVAKIDGTQSTLLLQRFFVQHFPHIAHLHAGQLRVYDGPRSEADLSDFALEGWREFDPQPFYLTPNSAFGRLVGRILRVPEQAQRLYRFLHDTLHLPALAVVAIFLTFPILMGVAAICFLDWWHTSRGALPRAAAARPHQQ